MRTPVRGRVAIALILGLMGAATAAAPAEAAPAPQVPRLVWNACGGPYDCARVLVPLDYDDPRGAQIPISLIRLPASDPARRIGSLFVNPGGPGGSGVDLVRSGAAQVIFTPAVRARFDVVGFDPRGVARSRPLKCFATNEDEARFFEDSPIFPYTESQVAPYFSLAARFGQHCVRHGGAIIRHMSTANVARDLDRLRQAVGDDKLTYDGVSYGSILGSNYAALFPNNVRALVVDGVADPVAWTTGRPPNGGSLPAFLRVGSAHGAEDTLHQFTKLCDEAGPRRCPLAPGSRAKLDRLAARLLRGPIPFDPSFSITYDFYKEAVLGGLYATSDWPTLARDAADLYGLAFGAGPPAPTLRAAAARGWAAYDNFYDSQVGVLCADTVNPHDPSVWPRAIARQEANGAPFFAASFGWLAAPCAQWPATDADRYLGPFDRVTSAPVLVIGNLHDPATPYHGAKVVDDLLPRARLLTMTGWGHTTWFNSSRCIDGHVERYLIDGALPPVGTRCGPDFRPFTDPAPSEPAVALRMALRPRR